jgi:hypothetical protein
MHITIADYRGAIIGMWCRVVNPGGVVINYLRNRTISYHRSAVITMASETDTNIE